MFEIGIGNGTKVNSVMFLGAHCDDVEIGCGGTARKIAAAWPDVRIYWITFSSDSLREKETRLAAGKFLTGAQHADVRVESFRNGFFPYVGADIKAYFEALKAEIDPDVIFTHYRGDLHQDHRVINELTWNTFRNHLILEYEIPKFDGDIGVPNCFSPLSREELDFKTKVLLDCFESQRKKSWFTPETFQSIARLRGIECNAPQGLAEAFYIRKLRLSF